MSVSIGKGATRGVVVAMVVTVGASWAWLILVASQMGDMSSVLAMPMTSAWSGVQVALMVLMWVVMMSAMMLPSAMPMVVAYDRIDRASPPARRGSAAAFVAGYLVLWGAFAVAAAGLQWLLHSTALVDSMGVATRPWFAGGLLVAAGATQFSAWKVAMLRACRTPMGFLASSWQDGTSGALRMGLHHGRVCLGCCSILMGLLFVLGVMNLAWLTALAGFILAEKVLSRGELVSRVGGVLLMSWGVIVMIGV